LFWALTPKRWALTRRFGDLTRRFGDLTRRFGDLARRLIKMAISHIFYPVVPSELTEDLRETYIDKNHRKILVKIWIFSKFSQNILVKMVELFILFSWEFYIVVTRMVP